MIFQVTQKQIILIMLFMIVKKQKRTLTTINIQIREN